jgi:hypothetical protein
MYRRWSHTALLGLVLGSAVACSTAAAAPDTPRPQQRTGSQTQDEPKPYADVITAHAQSDSGMFVVHWVGNRLYYEIPVDRLGEEMLLVSRVAKSASGVAYGGQKFGEQTVRWERARNRILLRITAHINVAADSLPIARAVESSNFEPIVESFAIAAYSEDSAAVVIEVTPLFESDIPVLGLSRSRRTAYGISSIGGFDSDRSYVSSARSYPRNIEVTNVLTYRASTPPTNSPTGTVSIEMNHSMILLPERPMQPRIRDDRVGYFSVTQNDYGLDVQRAVSRTYITRWRLEPSDTAAWLRGELVDPIKPIVYYIDPATPEKWRPYLKAGIEDWLPAFEEAGFKNAIIARDPPSPEEDPEFSPEDVRYSVIRYLASPVRNASGPHVHDPRTGEILESDINWYHNAMGLVRNWLFVHTAAVFPDARGVEFPDSVMGQGIRWISAHEVGHTIGLQHAHKTSSAYPVDSLRSASFTCAMGTAPSIMDYARHNYVAQPEDEGVCLWPQVGPYDKHAIRWGYRPILDAPSAEAERATLDQWVQERDDPIYRYGPSLPFDPSSLSESLGDDPVKAGEYGIANLKRIVPNLPDWTFEEFEDFGQLEELYNSALGQWGQYVRHVTAIVGGVYRTARTRDEDAPVYEVVPAERQRAAMAFLNEHVFTPPLWLLDEAILTRIEHAGAVERLRQRQVGAVNNILDPGRMQRLIEDEARHGDDAYGLGDMMEDLRGGLWTELATGRAIDTYRRNLQRGYLERMHWLMTEEPPTPSGFFASVTTRVDVSQSDIRAFVRGELTALRGQVERTLQRRLDRATRYHLQDVLVRIDHILDPD